MGACTSVPNDPQISINAETLLDIMEVIIRSPRNGLEYLQSGQMNMSELQTFKWNGLNLLHLIYLYRCATPKHNDELLTIYHYAHKAMPELHQQLTQAEIRIYFINTGLKDKLELCNHRAHMLHLPSDVYPSSNRMVLYTDCTVKCQTSNALASKFGEHHMVIRPNLKFSEFHLYLYSKFGETFPRLISVAPVPVVNLVPGTTTHPEITAHPGVQVQPGVKASTAVTLPSGIKAQSGLNLQSGISSQPELLVQPGTNVQVGHSVEAGIISTPAHITPLTHTPLDITHCN